MKIMKSVILSITVILLASILNANEPAVSAQACHSLFDPVTCVDDQPSVHLEGDVRNIKVWLYIRNISENMLRIPTKGQIAVDRKRGEFKLSIVVSPKANPLRQVIVHPESDYSVVELQPGETTVIEEVDIGKVVNFESVKVVYTVDQKLASRYHFWSGTIEVLSKNLYPDTKGQPKGANHKGSANPTVSGKTVIGKI